MRVDKRKIFDPRVALAFDEAYYLTTYPDVANAGVDAMTHYMTYGWRERRKPNSWFDPNDYVSGTAELEQEDADPFRHFLDHWFGPATGVQLGTDQNAALRWLKRSANAALPTPMRVPSLADIALVRETFDAERYLHLYPDVAGLGIDPLLHFMTLGWIEGRDPNARFSTTYYLRHNDDIRRAGLNPYVHFLRHGRKETGRWVADVASAALLEELEHSDLVARQVAAATALDPMIAFPRTPRVIISPLLWAGDALVEAAETLRATLSERRYSHVIAVPHIRMSGAARVASILARTLAALRDPAEILIVTTETSEAEYGHWLPDGVRILDVSRILEHLAEKDRVSMMSDLLRGVDCKAVFNVNSRLMWQTLTRYGRQISQERKVVTYLFTWDETPEGQRGGYPIEWLRDTMNVHHLLLTDTHRLARDVADRLGLRPAAGATEMVALNTPVEAAPLTAQVRSAHADRPRFLWAGRFDRQKRVDLLVEIARRNPHVDFDVFGKPVLDARPLGDYDPPPNLVEHGTYRDLSEVLKTPYTGFVYTAQWDGLPTILLDMAQAGLPVIAPDVGGIHELIDSETGWLIHDFKDVDGYTDAIARIVKDPELARRKAKALQDRIGARYTQQGYQTALSEALARHGI